MSRDSLVAGLDVMSGIAIENLPSESPENPSFPENMSSLITFFLLFQLVLYNKTGMKPEYRDDALDYSMRIRTGRMDCVILASFVTDVMVSVIVIHSKRTAIIGLKKRAF